MTRVPLWEIRDNRTLSAYAKLAYLMLAARGGDIRPSVPTLAADMGVSVRTAQRALRELQDQGAIVVAARRTPSGDADANAYRLFPVQGGASQSPPSRQRDTTGGDCGTPEDITLKTSSEGTASGRLTGAQTPREHQAASDAEIITDMRGAVADYFGPREDSLLDDEDAFTLYALFVEPHLPVTNMRSYLRGIFQRGNCPSIETYLSKSPSWCPACDTDVWGCECAS